MTKLISYQIEPGTIVLVHCDVQPCERCIFENTPVCPDLNSTKYMLNRKKIFWPFTLGKNCKVNGSFLGGRDFPIPTVKCQECKRHYHLEDVPNEEVPITQKCDCGHVLIVYGKEEDDQ